MAQRRAAQSGPSLGKGAQNSSVKSLAIRPRLGAALGIDDYLRTVWWFAREKRIAPRAALGVGATCGRSRAGSRPAGRPHPRKRRESASMGLEWVPVERGLRVSTGLAGCNTTVMLARDRSELAILLTCEQGWAGMMILLVALPSYSSPSWGPSAY